MQVVATSPQAPGQVLSIKDKSSDPRVGAVLTSILIILTIAGVSACAATGGAASLSVSQTIRGVGASYEQKWSFSQIVQTFSVTFVGSTSTTLTIDAAQCSADREVPFLNFWQCSLPDSSTICLPPVPWGMWAATKGLAALAILFKVILVVLFIQKKQTGCSICGLFWLSIIFTGVAAITAVAAPISAINFCSPTGSLGLTAMPGPGANLLWASAGLQFIIWIVCQCVIAPKSSTTVVVMSNQAQPQQQYPLQQYPPQQYPPQQYPPQQYPPQQYPPQQYPPQQYPPQQYPPQQYPPQQDPSQISKP